MGWGDSPHGNPHGDGSFGGPDGGDTSLGGGDSGYAGSYAAGWDYGLGGINIGGYSPIGGLRSGERDRAGIEGQGDLGGEGGREYSSDPERTQYAGLSEEDINALIDKRIEEGGYKAPSAGVEAGLASARAAKERFQAAYADIDAQFGAHWKEVYGKNILGSKERAKDLGVSHRSEGALSEKIKKTVESTVDMGFEDASSAYLKANPDITEKTWSKGKSAWDHYIMYGKEEGRKWPGEKKDA